MSLTITTTTAPAPSGGRRWCDKGQHRRAERFFKSPKARTCSTCLRKRVASTSKDARLRETYGITLDEWNQILAAQGGACAICKGKRSTYDTDHDHALERELIAKGWTPLDAARASVRGLVCRRENRRLLPAAKDDPEILMSAINYLQHPPARAVLS